MDDQADGPSGPEEPRPVPEEPPRPAGLPELPPEVHTDADELRRLIDAGASSPEELRALAARIREHRELEETLWRREVKPALLESKKRRIRLSDLRDRPPDHDRSGPSGLGTGLLVVGAVLVLLLAATQGSALFVVVPVVAVVIVAYRQGKREVAGPTDARRQEPPT